MRRRRRRWAAWRLVPAVALLVVLAVPQAPPPPVDLPQPELRRTTLLLAGGADGWRTSGVLPAGDTVLVGAELGDAVVEVRWRRAGVWSAWTPLESSDDHLPDPDSAEAERARPGVSEPLWVGRVEALQVRSRGPGAVRLVRVELPGDLSATPRPRSGAQAATTAPEIITREGWGADESLRRYRPVYADRVRFAVVHHTATSNDYGPEEADDVVRAIYAYHVRSRGFDDIGYNFLIDRYGRVYEGRAGGVTEPVVGAHAAGFNEGSVGVALIGHFQQTPPASAALDALDRLLAWRLDLAHVDPESTTVEIAGGGRTNRYEEGTRVELPRIIGHRTTGSTVCPGDLLFDHVEGSDPAAPRVAAIGLPKAYGGPPAHREQPRYGIRPRWQVAFTDTAEWRLEIRDADGGRVRATGGVGDAVDLTWDLRGADGELVPPGTYTAALTASTADGEVTPVVTTFEVTPAVERRSGPTRIETAVALSQRVFRQARRVVVAGAEAYADALAAGPLAASLGAPVLLVPPDHLPEVVADEIDRLGAEEVWVVGGPVRVSDRVIDALLARPEVEEVHRRFGPDRYATAAAVARTVIAREDPDEVLIALGAHPDPARAFPDALTAGAFGATFDLPLLLVSPGVLPEATAQVLASRRWAEGVTVVGGPAAVDEATAAAAAAAADAPWRRLAGADRFATAVAVADETHRRWAQQQAEEGPDPHAEPTGWEVVVASGANWPDALGAGPAVARRGAVLLLALGEELPAATAGWLEDHAAEVAHGFVVGGPAAIGPAVEDAVADRISSAGPAHDPPVVWPPPPGEEPPPASPTLPLPTLP